MDFRILGPVEVVRDGHAVRLGGPKERTLLAVLLVHANRPVSVTTLVDELWGESSAPSGAAVTLRGHVSRLRRALRDPDRIETRDPGYMLHAAADEIDASRFERLVGHARETVPDEASALLTEALGLWRGPALADVAASSECCHVEAARLDDARLGALEDRLEAELALGRHEALASELDALVAQHPARERMWGQLMLALYRAGRQADALAAYARLRERLADELGIDPSAGLAELERAILRQDPALVLAEPRRAEAPELVGRERELREVAELLSLSGVVTLVGPGGIGKTALAGAVAATLPDPVWWVELTDVDDDGRVVGKIAAALGVRESPGRGAGESVAELLEARPGTVVLDNCEHVLAGCAGFVNRFAGVSHVLATSREPLGVGGEQRFAVPPLSLDGRPTDAARLFVERARRARAGFSPDHDEAEIVEAICERLGGLPLAIELAAARTDVLGVRDIERRLSLSLLESDAGGTRPAHRTMRAAIDWSHSALDEPGRIVFRRASVFAGGFTLEDAEAVCAGDPVDPPDVLRVVSRLTSVSLVLVRDAGGTSRFVLLEPIRRYAAEQLEASGEEARVRDRLVARVLARPDDLWTDIENVRVALSWAVGAGSDSEAGLEIATRLAVSGRPRGQLQESRRWLEAALERASSASAWLALAGIAIDQGDSATAVSAAVRSHELAADERSRTQAVLTRSAGELLGGDVATAKRLLEDGLQSARALKDDALRLIALGNLGRIAWQEARFADAAELMEEALGCARRAGDDESSAKLLLNLGELARMRGHGTQAIEHLDAALRTARANGFLQIEAAALGGLGNVANATRDFAAARAHFEEALAIARRIGDRRLVSATLANLGSVAESLGELDVAERSYAEFVANAERFGDRRWEGRGKRGLADVLRAKSQLGRAGALLAEALRAYAEAVAPDGVCECIESAAALALVRDEPDAAARLLGAAGRLREKIGSVREPAGVAACEELERACVKALGAERYGALSEELDPQEAEGWALRWLETTRTV